MNNKEYQQEVVTRHVSMMEHIPIAKRWERMRDLLWTAGTIAVEIGTMRKDDFILLQDLAKEQLIDKLCDVLWYVTIICTLIDIPLHELMRRSISKLSAEERALIRSNQ